LAGEDGIDGAGNGHVWGSFAGRADVKARPIQAGMTVFCNRLSSAAAAPMGARPRPVRGLRPRACRETARLRKPGTPGYFRRWCGRSG
jgi:hypothetical protein